MLCCVWCVFCVLILSWCYVCCACVWLSGLCVSLRRLKRWIAIDFLMPWIVKILASTIATIVLLLLLLLNNLFDLGLIVNALFFSDFVLSYTMF